MKKCISCGTAKKLSEFGRNAAKVDGLNPKCRPCYNIYQSLWYEKNKDTHKKRVRRSRTSERVAADKYDISIEDVEKLRKSNNGLCHICNEVIATDIDHDHLTGQVRGHLCRGCNYGLGNFRDRIDRLQAAMLYLQNQMPQSPTGRGKLSY